MTHPLQAYLHHHRLDRLWQAYEVAIDNGDIPSLESLGVTGLKKRSRLGFTSLSVPETEAQLAANQTIQKLLDLWQRIYGKDVAAMKKEFIASNLDQQERRIFELGMALLEATKTARLNEMKELIDAGVPMNFQHPVNEQTALHIVASGGSMGLVEILVNTNKCDYLIRDKLGKQPWNNADFFNPDPEIKELILAKTKEQAAQEGVNLFEEHKTYLRKWFREPWYNNLSLFDEYIYPDDAASDPKSGSGQDYPGKTP